MNFVSLKRAGYVSGAATFDQYMAINLPRLPWFPNHTMISYARSHLGPNARSGSGEVLAGILLDLKALGVNHVGVRFRARSADELLDQIDAFAHEVAPHL